MNKTEDWISCYVFHNTDFENVLMNLVKPLVAEFTSKDLVNLFFFVRYWENGPHIRLRMLPSSHIAKTKIIKLLHDKTTSYFKKIGQDYVIEFNDYINEFQRYGGLDNIEVSQKHFHDSSHTVLNRIFQAENWDYSLAISSAIQLHLVFAKQIIRDEEDVTLYFETLYNTVFINSVKLDDNQDASQKEILKVKNFFLESYEKQKDVIEYIVFSIWHDKNVNTHFTNWSFRCAELRKLIEEKQQNNKIVAPEWFEFNSELKIGIEKQILWCIYDSYIHMTNNRLGVFLRDEAYIVFLILKGLKSIKIKK